MSSPVETSMSSSLGTTFVQAIANQDASALKACFADDVQLRALIPGGLRERVGAFDSAALIASWFADSTELNVAEWSAQDVGDRFHIWYRVVGVEEGHPYVVEQHLFCVLTDGRISRAHLLCSGFRPRDD